MDLAMNINGMNDLSRDEMMDTNGGGIGIAIAVVVVVVIVGGGLAVGLIKSYKKHN